MTLGAEIQLASKAGSTSMPADDFFIGPMVTSIDQGQCVRAIRFPVWPHRRIGVGFFEVSSRRSDFAFVSAAAQVALDEEGRCLDVALGLGGVADRLHTWLARDGAPGLAGERRGVIEGVVLGEDQDLSDLLKQRFRASGLYHLLAVCQ